MEVKLIDHMGSDLSVVNSARVSFNKESEAIEMKDKKLIKYLATHNHLLPLRIVLLRYEKKYPSL